MAETAISFLLDNLVVLGKRQVKLYMNAKNEFRLLEHELEEMKGILKDAAQNPREEEQFKAWEKRVRDVVYDAEDTIDSWITKGNPLLSYVTPNSMGERVKKLREGTVKPAFERYITAYNEIPMSKTRGRVVDTVRDRQNKAPREDNVVGFQDQIDILKDYVLEEAKTLDVISIIGKPGLGKTTVARKVYNHPQIDKAFPIRIWVYVSLDFNLKEILLTILRKFKPLINLSTKSEDELSFMVKKELEKRDFLLVMDDVWEEEAWDQIQELLTSSNGKGKVLITSRNVKVGDKSNSKREPHQLRDFLDKESLELLQIEAFRMPSGFPKTLEAMCNLIAVQCGRLPLAVIIIGGVLAGKRPPGQADSVTWVEWEKVSLSVKTYLNKGGGTNTFISLSYTTLPYHLRDCFLYMGMFPEDAAIPAWKLRQMWIAEGLVLQEKERDLEEVAKENLKDLIDRNLVQVDTVKPNGEVKTCRLHDTIREFCISEAAVEKQNLFQEISISRQGAFHPSIHVVEKSRRLCIHSSVDMILSKHFPKNKVSKARALLCFSNQSFPLDITAIKTITNASDMLRVLEMSSISFSQFHKSFFELVHLRYISFTVSQLKSLPDISDLCNLQTILVVTTERTLKVKANLWKMVQLRHFKTKAAIVLTHQEGEESVNLQTLGRLSPESCTNVFKKAKNLNVLGIRGDLNKVDFNVESFVSLEKLEKLKLHHDVYPVLDKPWNSFPQRVPTCLKSLSLKTTHLEWKDMSYMGRLHTLEVLKLKEKAFKGKYWAGADSGGFARLRFLHIENCELEVWEAAPESYPILKSLVIKNCEKLLAVPSPVADKLDMMYLEHVKESIATSAREIAAKKNKGLTIPAFKLVVISASG